MGKSLFAVVIILAALFCCGDAYGGYRAELTRASHNGRLFSFETWDAKLIWHATFFSDRFRQSYDEEYAGVNHMDEAEAAQFFASEERRQANGWDFFISFYTKKDYKKFSTDSDTFWSIRLTTASGEVVKATEIEAIPVSPYQLVMFRHLNRWSKAYRVTFPKVDLGDEFTVTIESVVGESSLKWKNK